MCKSVRLPTWAGVEVPSGGGAAPPVRTSLVLLSIPGVPAAHHLTGVVRVAVELRLHLGPGGEAQVHVTKPSGVKTMKTRRRLREGRDSRQRVVGLRALWLHLVNWTGDTRFGSAGRLHFTAFIGAQSSFWELLVLSHGAWRPFLPLHARYVAM